MNTERLYYYDCYLSEFQAQVTEAADGGRRVYLDRTGFYPTSGGQMHDLGTLGGVAVTEVVDEDDRVAHVLAAPIASGEVSGAIDWARRYDLMQQHTGQHLLSAVFEELFGFGTVSVHMGLESSTVDLNTVSVTPEQMARAEERCAEIVAEARPVRISFEDASVDLGLRKESARSGTLRIISIEGADRSACGGTHVRTSAEIGCILTGSVEKIRGISRVEFVCGIRALRRARTDAALLSKISRTLSMPAEQSPEIVAALVEKNKSLEKERTRLAIELARREGRDLFSVTAPGPDGLRRVTQTGPIDDAMRSRAQGFVEGSRSQFLAICEQPPSALLAVSADSGVHASDRMKAALGPVGGRGGGNQGLAQGSALDLESLKTVIAALSA